MEMYIWNSVIVLSKTIFYIGFACFTGYTFLGRTLMRGSRNLLGNNDGSNIRKLTIALIFSVLIANVAWFFASTGAMVEEGIQGAFDPDMVSIMWDSSIGESTLFRILGLIVAIFAMVSPRYLKFIRLNQYLKQGLYAISLLILAYSFVLIGHVSELDTFDKALFMIHVLVMAWWFGSLVPLHQACKTANYEDLYCLMEVFGKQASVLVSLLLFAGLVLAIQLLGNLEALFNSSYGQTLLVKLLS